MLMVVCHADAGDRRSWNGPDMLRPLSVAGRRQAEGLVIRLEDFPVERILCGPTLRCRQTVEPLARDRFLEMEPVEALGVGADPTRMVTGFWEQELHDAVLCTHGETIGRLLTELVAQGLVVDDALDWPKGSTWLLQRSHAVQGGVRGRLLAPLALDGAVLTS